MINPSNRRINSGEVGKATEEEEEEGGGHEESQHHSIETGLRSNNLPFCSS